MRHKKPRNIPEWGMFQNGRYVKLPRCVYLAITQSKTFIKVGFSFDPNRRMKDLRAYCQWIIPCADIELIGCRVGTVNEESRINKLVRETFPRVRVNRSTEWFHWSQELEDFLRPMFTMTAEDAVSVMTIQRRDAANSAAQKILSTTATAA